MTTHSASRSQFEVPSAIRRDDRLLELKKMMDELRGLPVGWDGHGGKPLDGAVADFTLHLLIKAMPSGTPLPQLVPLSHGGVQLEWHDDGIDLEIEIEAPNRTFFEFEDQRTGEVLEHASSTDFSDLSRIFRLLAARHLSAH